MKRGLIFSLIFLTSVLSASEREDKIRELMEAQGLLTTFEQQLNLGREQSYEQGKVMLEQLMTNLDPSPEYQQEIHQSFEKYMESVTSPWGADELVAVWSKYYGSKFTDTELDTLIKHYTSPLGQKEIIASREALIQYSNHFADAGTPIYEKAFQTFADELKEIAKRCNCIRKSNSSASTKRSLENAELSDLGSLLDQARSLRDNERYEESLQSYLRFFERSRGTSYAGVRLSYVPSEMVAMGQSYAPSIEAVRALRDEREKRIFASQSSWDDLHEWSSLSEILDGTQYIITLYDQLRLRGNNDPIILSKLLELNWEHFVEAGRHPELASLAFQKLGQLNSMIESMEDSDDPEIRDAIAEYAIQEYARVYEVFLATENTEEANKLSEKVLGLNQTGAAYHALIKGAEAAGKADIAAVLLADAQNKLSPEELKIAKYGKPKPAPCSKRK